MFPSRGRGLWRRILGGRLVALGGWLPLLRAGVAWACVSLDRVWGVVLVGWSTFTVPRESGQSELRKLRGAASHRPMKHRYWKILCNSVEKIRFIRESYYRRSSSLEIVNETSSRKGISRFSISYTTPRRPSVHTPLLFRQPPLLDNHVQQGRWFPLCL